MRVGLAPAPWTPGLCYEVTRASVSLSGCRPNWDQFLTDGILGATGALLTLTEHMRRPALPECVESLRSVNTRGSPVERTIPNISPVGYALIPR